ncbi:hypothetical protein SteCoe_18244 [Stentor coeruleus]|uniref:Peptidase C1A papain C-terminal domain-containing protein n=1 Tax=Stentor coeruleus TaxID=5963 RepID=A0A1R2BX95_9CILI|nr:hypothetical protein SteCoe_18244 [Stentor coeruleus]
MKKGVFIGLGVIGMIVVVGMMKNPLIYERYQVELEEFESFMSSYGKVYKDDDEKLMRFRVFKDNLSYIRVINLENHSWTLAANFFSDLTFEEFSNIQLDKSLNDETNENPDFNILSSNEKSLNLPNSIDWRAKNAVTPIKNQQSCGCGWAFATTASVEGAWKINGHPLISMSEQQLVDCSSSYGNKGCTSGTIVNALKYVQANGLANETAYPYTASTKLCSKSKAALVVAKISSYNSVQSSSSNSLMTAIVNQPIAVAVDANPTYWQFYSSGVIDGNCGTTINHNVLVVGYFTIAGQTPYYVCKNSWGPSWGMSGYVQISIVDGLGTCGIQTSPAYPVV